MAAEPKIHYAGALSYGSVEIRTGYAACCSGPRAIHIRMAGNNTRERGRVTCKSCLRVLALAQAGVSL